MKTIIIIEDEPGVHDIFRDIFEGFNIKIFEKDIYTIKDLNNSDYIFIDRDNPYSKDFNYHTYFLEIVNGNLTKELIEKIYFISGTELNNKALISGITSLCIYDNNENYLIKSRDEQEYYEKLMKSHMFTKSFPEFKNNLKKIAQ